MKIEVEDGTNENRLIEVLEDTGSFHILCVDSDTAQPLLARRIEKGEALNAQEIGEAVIKSIECFDE